MATTTALVISRCAREYCYATTVLYDSGVMATCNAPHQVHDDDEPDVEDVDSLTLPRLAGCAARLVAVVAAERVAAKRTTGEVAGGDDAGAKPAAMARTAAASAAAEDEKETARAGEKRELERAATRAGKRAARAPAALIWRNHPPKMNNTFSLFFLCFSDLRHTNAVAFGRGASPFTQGAPCLLLLSSPRSEVSDEGVRPNRRRVVEFLI